MESIRAPGRSTRTLSVIGVCAGSESPSAITTPAAGARSTERIRVVIGRDYALPNDRVPFFRHLSPAVLRRFADPRRADSLSELPVSAAGHRLADARRHVLARHARLPRAV